MTTDQDWKQITPGIQQAAFQELLGELDNDWDTLAEIATLFLQNAPLHVEGVSRANAAGNAAAAKGPAHSLKSSSASLGALRLSKLCEAVERQPALLPTLAAALAEEYEVVREDLIRRLPALARGIRSRRKKPRRFLRSQSRTLLAISSS